MTDTIENLRAERDLLLQDDREAKRLMTLADGGRLPERVAQMLGEWRHALAALAAEKTRADDLSRMVAAMGEAFDAATTEAKQLEANGDVAECMKVAVLAMCNMERILSRPDVAAERGRWVSRDAIGVALVDGMRTERDAAIARAEKAEQYADWLDEKIARERDAAERSRDELGIQFAACQERLRLAMACAEHLRDAIEDNDVISRAAQDALAALDAVPGDALQPVSAAYRSDIGPALDRAHEASGVVTRYDAIANKRDPGPDGVKVTP